MAVVFVAAIQEWQWNEPRLAWKSMRHMLDVWGRLSALWTQALGPQASRQTAPFIQNHCQKKKKTDPQGRMSAHVAKNRGPLQLVTHFCEKCRFMWPNRRACESLLRGLAECGGESYFILIYPFVDEYTRSSQTYSGHYAALKASQGNKRASAASVVVNWNDEQMAVTQQPKSLSFYWWFSVARWIMSVTSTHRGSSNRLLLPGYTVIHYIATITMLKLFACRQSLPWNHSTCLHVSTIDTLISPIVPGSK